MSPQGRCRGRTHERHKVCRNVVDGSDELSVDHVRARNHDSSGKGHREQKANPLIILTRTKRGSVPPKDQRDEGHSWHHRGLRVPAPSYGGLMSRIDFSSGSWTHEPVSVTVDGDHIVVEAKENSDAWRTTSYGFIHDSEHGLVAPLQNEQAVEVSFAPGSLCEQFDQAGIFLVADSEHWIKAGLEFADGELQLGAVVTWPVSDWSVAPVPEWRGASTVTIRASRSGDAITVRARADDGPLRLVRLIPVPPEAELRAGPLVAAPSRAGLKVIITEWQVTDPDGALH